MSSQTLFIAEGDTPADLLKTLDSLDEQLQETTFSTEALSRAWFVDNPQKPEKKYAVVLIAENPARLQGLINFLFVFLLDCQVKHYRIHKKLCKIWKQDLEKHEF